MHSWFRPGADEGTAHPFPNNGRERYDFSFPSSSAGAHMLTTQKGEVAREGKIDCRPLQQVGQQALP